MDIPKNIPKWCCAIKAGDKARYRQLRLKVSQDPAVTVSLWYLAVNQGLSCAKYCLNKLKQAQPPIPLYLKVLAVMNDEQALRLLCKYARTIPDPALRVGTLGLIQSQVLRAVAQFAHRGSNKIATETHRVLYEPSQGHPSVLASLASYHPSYWDELCKRAKQGRGDYIAQIGHLAQARDPKAQKVVAAYLYPAIGHIGKHQADALEDTHLQWVGGLMAGGLEIAWLGLTTLNIDKEALSLRLIPFTLPYCYDVDVLESLRAYEILKSPVESSFCPILRRELELARLGSMKAQRRCLAATYKDIAQAVRQVLGSSWREEDREDARQEAALRIITRIHEGVSKIKNWRAYIRKVARYTALSMVNKRGRWTKQEHLEWTELRDRLTQSNFEPALINKGQGARLRAMGSRYASLIEDDLSPAESALLQSMLEHGDDPAYIKDDGCQGNGYAVRKSIIMSHLHALALGFHISQDQERLKAYCAEIEPLTDAYPRHAEILRALAENHWQIRRTKRQTGMNIPEIRVIRILHLSILAERILSEHLQTLPPGRLKAIGSELTQAMKNRYLTWAASGFYPITDMAYFCARKGHYTPHRKMVRLLFQRTRDGTPDLGELDEGMDNS